jgi:peroxiredoxin
MKSRLHSGAKIKTVTPLLLLIFKGKKVVLYFYPEDELHQPATVGCMQSPADNYGLLKKKDSKSWA